ncbi:hypothetical protein PG997_002527 [Apiospora hydei]|uniref:Uncharacterized protein n=1 Tax=Apiospora hydei TaxID=1337664 RepID=A0ABR1WWN1_9PEZI
MSALRFAAQLSGARYGHYHPYHAALRTLTDLVVAGELDRRTLLPTVFDWYYRFLGDYADPGHPLRSRAYQWHKVVRILELRSDPSWHNNNNRDTDKASSTHQISQNMNEIVRSMCRHSVICMPVPGESASQAAAAAAPTRQDNSSTAEDTVRPGSDRCGDYDDAICTSGGGCQDIWSHPQTASMTSCASSRS